MRDSFVDNWWTAAVDKGDVNCTDQELEMFLNKALLITVYPSSENSTALTDTGITGQQFHNEYNLRALQMNYEVSGAGGRAYDAVWILAAALNRTMVMVESGNINGTGCENITGSLVPLEQFQYSNEKLGCLIQYNIQMTNFTGGHIQFDSNGTRIQNIITLKQYRHSEFGGNISKTEFAFLNAQQGYSFTFLPGLNDTNVYHDGIPPDGTATKKTVTYSIPLVIVSYCLALIGELFAIICLAFSIAFRDRRMMKHSSHNLNYLIIVGAMCMYASVVAHLVPTTAYATVQATCQLSNWLFIAGYTLSFGSMLGRMWRVLYTYQNPKISKKFVQDWYMVMVVLIIAGVGMAIVSIETIVSGQKGFATKSESYEHPKGAAAYDVQEFYYVWMCLEPSTPALYMRALIYAYLAALQIVGIVLAFQTRKVKYSVLVLDTFVLGGYLNTSGTLLAVGVVTLTTAILLLIFVPKMILLYRERICESLKRSSPGQNSLADSGLSGNDAKVISLEEELSQKEKLVSSLSLEMNNLKAVNLSLLCGNALRLWNLVKILAWNRDQEHWDLNTVH
eukprot:Em0013g408a